MVNFSVLIGISSVQFTGTQEFSSCDFFNSMFILLKKLKN